ncbi:MAG: hypothetical protein JO184_03740 [Gammaproteobacteria bacterium]|nr:hypothetical protein [Gammaproteobacteria bacterium]MBV8403863.1 hypothetical protein [Gammaproteobacteria bacterium]
MIRSCVLLLAVPPLAAAADAARREAVSFAPTRAVLVLIPGSEASQSLAAHRPAAIDAASTPEADLGRECANGEPQRPQAEKGLLFDIALRTWRLLLRPLAVSVHEELQKYAQVSGASASADFYRGGNSAPAAPLESRITCLRFTRFAEGAAGADEVALDFVAGVRLDTGRDAIRLRPLRLFISQGAAKSADGHYSVALAVRADAVWRDEFAGHQGEIFEHTAASESIDLKKGSYLKYYPSGGDSGARVPIVPVSFGADRSRDFGRAEFTVTVVELGTPPATLSMLADMLPDPDEKLTKLLISAATAGSKFQ